MSLELKVLRGLLYAVMILSTIDGMTSRNATVFVIAAVALAGLATSASVLAVAGQKAKPKAQSSQPPASPEARYSASRGGLPLP